MEIEEFLKLPIHRMADMSYDEYADTLTQCRNFLSSLNRMQQREGSKTVYQMRQRLIDDLRKMNYALMMHTYHQDYQYVGKLPQNQVAA